MRIYGLDVIRIISFWVISYYHFLYVIWRDRVDQYEVVMTSEPVYYKGILTFMHSLSFSGFTILIISTFLIGFRNTLPKIHWRLLFFIFAAWLLFSWADQYFQKLVLYWDVYPLLILGLLLIEVVHRRSPKATFALGLLGFMLTLFSFHNAGLNLPLWAEQMLVGNCAEDLANWPILPWIGLVFFGYALGVAGKVKLTFLQQISFLEIAVWAGLLIPSSFVLGAFYNLHEMRQFECLAYRLQPIQFWSHMIFILFLMRISLVKKINSRIEPHVSFLSKLQVSKNFFLVYAVHYVLCFVIAVTMGETVRANPMLFTTMMVLSLPLAEVVSYLISRFGAAKLVRGRV